QPPRTIVTRKKAPATTSGPVASRITISSSRHSGVGRTSPGLARTSNIEPIPEGSPIISHQRAATAAIIPSTAVSATTSAIFEVATVITSTEGATLTTTTITSSCCGSPIMSATVYTSPGWAPPMPTTLTAVPTATTTTTTTTTATTSARRRVPAKSPEICAPQLPPTTPSATLADWRVVRRPTRGRNTSGGAITPPAPSSAAERVRVGLGERRRRARQISSSSGSSLVEGSPTNVPPCRTATPSAVLPYTIEIASPGSLNLSVERERREGPSAGTNGVKEWAPILTTPDEDQNRRTSPVTIRSNGTTSVGQPVSSPGSDLDQPRDRDGELRRAVTVSEMQTVTDKLGDFFQSRLARGADDNNRDRRGRGPQRP
ncbi:hypothetical protein PV327_011575, partial [Microctonus hyperodae]